MGTLGTKEVGGKADIKRARYSNGPQRINNGGRDKLGKGAGDYVMRMMLYCVSPQTSSPPPMFGTVREEDRTGGSTPPPAPSGQPLQRHWASARFLADGLGWDRAMLFLTWRVLFGTRQTQDGTGVTIGAMTMSEERMKWW